MTGDQIGDETPGPAPVRRVTMTVTGYLRHGHPVGGWYDMQATASGGEHYSILQSHVDESSIRDAPPERLSADDWAEISAYVTSRYGTETGRRLLADWRRFADALDVERGAQ